MDTVNLKDLALIFAHRKEATSLARHKKNKHGLELVQYRCTIYGTFYCRKAVLQRNSIKLHEIPEIHL